MEEENSRTVGLIGKAPDEKKEEVRQDLLQRLFNHFQTLSKEEQDKLKENEIKKTLQQIELIEFINRETSLLMLNLGARPFSVPPKNFHILKEGFYRTIAEPHSEARTFFTKQGVLINGGFVNDNLLKFSTILFHEMLHLKGCASLEVEGDEGGTSASVYRAGLEVHALQASKEKGRNHTHFLGLSEAIIAEAEKRFFSKILNHPLISSLRDWLSSDEAREKKKKLAKEKGIPEEDIFWVGREDDDWEVFPYLEQRRVLNYVCEEIQKEFPEKFLSQNDVFNAFLRAHFTGNLLEIGRLVEKTFGEGSFRILGNMDATPVSGILHLETLESLRRKRLP